MLACSPIVNSRIRLRMINSTSVISDRLMSGSTSCSRVLTAKPRGRFLSERCSAIAREASRVEGRVEDSWDRRLVDDVLDDRVGRQPVAGGMRAEPEPMAQHLSREILHVFRIDLGAARGAQRP